MLIKEIFHGRQGLQNDRRTNRDSSFTRPFHRRGSRSKGFSAAEQLLPCQRLVHEAYLKHFINDLNLTIPSGMALVRVRYVAIRKSKTCSGSFGSRAGTLNKYVILNCWDRLPQKSSRVNVNLSGQGPSILLRKTILSLKSPTGAFIAALRFANANF